MVRLRSLRGEHLVNFEADHTEIVGLNPFPQLQSLFTLIEDNVVHSDHSEPTFV